jgi:hypothetical protein
MQFHTAVPISTKFGMMVSDALGEILDIWKRIVVPVEPNLFPYYFFYKKRIWSVAIMGSWQQLGHESNGSHPVSPNRKIV